MAISHTFPYTTFMDAGGGEFHRPLLPIQFLHNTKSIQSEALVDSGADISVLPYRMGLELGLVWEDQTAFVSLSGVFAAHKTRIVVVNARIADFAQLPLIFAWSSAPDIRFILGQKNFFNRFNITFRLAENIFEITSSIVNP